VANPSPAEIDLLARLIAEATEWAAGGRGGPFAAAVLYGGEIVGRGRNEVVASGDPTAHAEMLAIRQAAACRGTHDLSGASLVTTCEPCPMCLGAAFWARVDRIVYGATRHAAASSGFDDEALYREVTAPVHRRALPLLRALPERALDPFHAWDANPERRPY